MTKELNFRKLEERYERQLAQERAARLEAEKAAQEATVRNNRTTDEDDDTSEPYVDHKKLNKTLNKFVNRQNLKLKKQWSKLN